MRIFRLRPLALGCAVFLLCLYTSYFLGNVFDIILISIGGLGFISLIAFNARKSTRRSISLLVYLLPVCACLVLSGIVALGTFYRDSRILEDNVGKEKECELLVTEERYSSNSEMVAIATDGETELLVAIPLENEQKISVGDTIKATAYIRELDNTGIGYNEKEYYLDKGIFMYAECEKYELISSGNFVFKQSLRKINSFLDGALKDFLNSDTASLTSAMLLGNKGALDGSIRRDFSRLGISHILALSGIHISLITAMLGALLNALMLRRRIKYLCLVSMICAFVGITGFSESAMRAGLMLMIFYTLSLFGKDSDSVTSLFVSMLLICILDPYAIFSTSLLLSFSAMIGCLCSAHYTRRVRPLYRIRPKFIRAIVYSLITSVTVVLFTLPIMMLRFDYVSLFAPVFNIFMVPPLTLLLYLAPFVLLIGWIPYLSLVVTFPSECIVRLCLWITKNASRADFLTVSFVNVGQKIGVLLVLVA
ncbi:MAG: ComEC/Rec2 family competence protein, partial [Clostridia bacterium]|nr:ComEC/Rec2 family competence protein [Clostridia bacterium]